MTEKAVVEDLLNQRTWAVVGASRGGRKFGNVASRELRKKGYRVIPVHPDAENIDGERCYRSLSELPDEVGALLLVVPPAETEKVVREASETGIGRVWMQQGAESDSAIRHCHEQGMSLVHGECILMYAAPTGVHRLHRWVWRLLGKLPQ
ncbi:MAG: CoA-binding protein [Gemmatimonadota bacterium]|nr:MAG: CoA-binding protein [Gemmatimonadota bacterium]